MKRTCFALIGLLCVLLMLFTGCTAGNQQETIITINNREIKKPEFMLYLYEATQDFKYIGGNDIWETDFDGQTAEELVKERTFSTIKTVILSCQKAGRYDVRLTEEDKALAKENGDAEWEAMTPEEQEAIGITKEEIYRVMEDTLTYSKVYEAVTKDFQASPADFEAYLETHQEEYQNQYTKYTVSSILVKEEETAREVAQKAREGQDFKELFQQYDQDLQEQADDGGVMETFKANLDTAFGVDFTLEEGEISQPLKTAEGYFIIRVDRKQIPTQEEIENIAQADYTAIRKRQIFEGELAQWTAEAAIEKNDEAWNQIEMIP